PVAAAGPVPAGRLVVRAAPDVDDAGAGVGEAAGLQVERAAGGQQPLNELAVHGKVQAYSAHTRLQDGSPGTCQRCGPGKCCPAAQFPLTRFDGLTILTLDAYVPKSVTVVSGVPYGGFSVVGR